jgi:hypothetical protein
VRILRGFLKGVHWSRITGSQIHPVRNATKSRACCGNDAPRAEKRDTDSKVLALSSELGNPHRTRVPTFPQQRLRRRTNLPKLQNPPKSQGLTDSCAEPNFQHAFASLVHPAQHSTFALHSPSTGVLFVRDKSRVLPSCVARICLWAGRKKLSLGRISARTGWFETTVRLDYDRCQARRWPANFLLPPSPTLN